MRLKAEVWVMAYVRRVNAAGGMAMIAKRGDADAGAIYIKVSDGAPAWREDRTAALYGPAPSGFSEGQTDRQWVEQLPASTPEARIEEALERQRKFDSDIWIIDVDDRERRHFLDGWLMAPDKP